MSNLIRTYPDNGVTPSQYIPADIDMGELASRLGSADRYRREGRIISQADFSPTNDGWWIHPLERPYCFYSPEYSIIGNASLCTLGGDHLTTNGIEKYLPITSNLTYGLSFYTKVDTHLEQRTSAVIRMSNGVKNIQGGVRVWWKNGQVFYYDNSGTWYNFFTDLNLVSLYKWVNIKIIVDFETNKYLRIFINNVDVLNAQPLMYSLTPVAEYLTHTTIYSISTLAGNTTHNYIDAPVITIHEF